MALELGNLSVRVESAVLPPFTISPFAEGDGSSSGPGLLERAARPKVTVLEGTKVIYTFAPAGDPPTTPWVGIGLAAGVVAGAVALFLLGRMSAR